jgi:hypothetical protein
MLSATVLLKVGLRYDGTNVSTTSFVPSSATKTISATVLEIWYPEEAESPGFDCRCRGDRHPKVNLLLEMLGSRNVW